MSGDERIARLADLKARAASVVGSARDEILGLSHAIHDRPEISYEEHFAAEQLATCLRKHGYEVEKPVAGLPTALRGRVSGRVSDHPSVGLLAEYDALAGIGHGCGHNTMAAAGVGAAIALAALQADLPGTAVFLGTPAEEFGSAKARMVEEGLFDGLDAVLMFHPADRTATCDVTDTSLESEDQVVTFDGLAAHASSDPWNGRNALDGLVALYVAVALWRQQLRPQARVHAVILDGGEAVNIIPKRAVGEFRLRAPTEGEFQDMRERFEQMARAAAAATGTSVTFARSGHDRVLRTNPVLAHAWNENMRALGQTLVPAEPDRSGSTDMGNVSQVVPTIHPVIAIAPEGTPFHSDAFAAAARTPLADEVTLTAAIAVASTAIDVLVRDDLRAAAWSAFRALSHP